MQHSAQHTLHYNVPAPACVQDRAVEGLLHKQPGGLISSISYPTMLKAGFLAFKTLQQKWSLNREKSHGTLAMAW